MAETTTDALERSILSGAVFGGRDPDGVEPLRARQTSPGSDDGLTDDVDSAQNNNTNAFTHPDDLKPASSTYNSARMPAKGMSHNTGVKGVLADFREQQRKSKELQRPVTGKPVSGPRSKSLSSDEDDLDGELSDGERAARDAYRRQRMEEMRMMGSGERSMLRNMPRFGHLREIGQSQFVKAVEEKEGTVVVVHVYDSSIPICSVLNTHLSSLARSYPYTKFVRAMSHELEFALGDEEDVLPTLLVYRGGQSWKTLVAFDQELNEGDEEDDESITRQRVEEVLIKHQIIDPTMAAKAASCTDEDSE